MDIEKSLTNMCKNLVPAKKIGPTVVSMDLSNVELVWMADVGLATKERRSTRHCPVAR